MSGRGNIVADRVETMHFDPSARMRAIASRVALP